MGPFVFPEAWGAIDLTFLSFFFFFLPRSDTVMHLMNIFVQKCSHTLSPQAAEVFFFSLLLPCHLGAQTDLSPLQFLVTRDACWWLAMSVSTISCLWRANFHYGLKPQGLGKNLGRLSVSMLDGWTGASIHVAEKTLKGWPNQKTYTFCMTWQALPVWAEIEKQW